jgi:hypothetical protein
MVFTGIDEISAVFGAGSVLLFGGGTALSFSGARPWSFALLALSMILAAGCRYELRLSSSGIRLTLYRFWLVPVYRRHELLDADIDLYQSFESDTPEGLCIRPPLHLANRMKESDSFGPHFNKARMLAVHGELVAALDRLRAAAPPPPRELRNALLAPYLDALDLDRAVRDTRGRLREVASTAAIEIGGVLLPPNTLFYLNDGMFTDPRRDDELREVVLSDACVIRDLLARAGGRLDFDGDGRLRSVRAGFDREVLLEDIWVDGHDTISFDADGRLSGFILARATRFAGLRIPAGTRFMCWPGNGLLPAHWTCWLGGELDLPEITLRRGESIELSLERDSLRAFSPRRDVRLGNLMIRHDIVPIPVRSDGRIDVRRCKRLGILGRADERIGQT